MYFQYDPKIEKDLYKQMEEYVCNDHETCLIEEFFKQHPEAVSACISCSCPKCSPRC